MNDDAMQYFLGYAGVKLPLKLVPPLKSADFAVHPVNRIAFNA